MAGTIVTLEHAFFHSVPDGLFRKSDIDQPVFVVKLGDIEAGLPINGILREFSIPESSPDGEMLALVVKALDFVTVLRIGDSLPTEVLTGVPSWEITQAHRVRAYQRLTLQLTTWLTGEERVFTGADELNQIAEDPAMKKKVNEAFDEAAKKLGFAQNGREEVVKLVGSLAEELAFIEALRDRYDNLVSAGKKLQMLRRAYGREQSVRDIADSVARLMNLALKAFQTSFEEVDAQTGEIISVLKNPTQQVQYIRKARDNLYCRLFAWRELMVRWDNTNPAREERNVVLLRDTYRFLAPRFMPAVEWQLMSKLGSEKVKAKTSVVW